MMTILNIAIDIGMTNIDLVVDDGINLKRFMLKNRHGKAVDQVDQALTVVSDEMTAGVTIGVTGGRYRDLPEYVGGYRIQKVDEMLALGLGGLALAKRDAGLVVSAGTGSAMVAAQGQMVSHVTGSAVGGGTLLGLSKLILGTNEVEVIDHLALAGDAANVDIMLNEAVGSEVGRLPAHANAVNLGKLARNGHFTREDLAAGLARLVAQVIAVIAINAADAEGFSEIIMVGHLMDLGSICQEIALVGEFYKRSFTLPENPGFGTAVGVLMALKQDHI